MQSILHFHLLGKVFENHLSIVDRYLFIWANMVQKQEELNHFLYTKSKKEISL